MKMKVGIYEHSTLEEKLIYLRDSSPKLYSHIEEIVNSIWHSIWMIEISKRSDIYMKDEKGKALNPYAVSVDAFQNRFIGNEL